MISQIGAEYLSDFDEIGRFPSILQSRTVALGQQPLLEIVQLLREIHLVDLRLFDPPVLVPEGLALARGERHDLSERRALIDDLSVLADKLEQRLDAVIGERRALPSLERVEDRQRFGYVELLVVQADQVGLGHSGAVVDAQNLLEAGIGDLDRVLGDLDDRLEPAAALDRRQLVHAAQTGHRLTGDQLGANAPAVDPGALAVQGDDRVLVQIARRADGGLGEAGLVQHPAGLLREVCKVARIQTDTGRLMALFAQLAEHLNGVRHAALEGIVGIDQQQAVVREQLRIGAECLH